MQNQYNARDTRINPLAQEVNEQYEAAYLHKDMLGLHDEWIRGEQYYNGEQVIPEDEDDPASNTNIIQPNIESIIADLVSSPTEILISGWTTTDRAAAPRAQIVADWVWDKNEMTVKREQFERYRAKLGGAPLKVYFDGDMSAVGMPIIEPISPINFFPDPKVTSPETLKYADYIIHAVTRPLNYLKRIYGEKANKLEPRTETIYNPEIFSESEQQSPYSSIMSQKALVLERWTIESDGHLRKVVVCQNVVLYDSDESETMKTEGYFRIKRYPFVYIPCYRREGRLWGSSDIKFLIPVQDIINDLDDQIRMNARLMGNLQIVVSVMSGINAHKWTNKPGLKVPAYDPQGFQLVQPRGLPSYIENRRNQALTYESQIISGRTDAVEGRGAGSVRAASAIIALQEAGSRRVNHKRLMAERGFKDVLGIVMDYIMEYWTEEVEIGEELMFRGSDLKELAILLENGRPLLNEDGTTATRRANFDISVNLGSGMPSNKSFIYQACLELVQYGIVTPEEARMLLKEILHFPMIDPFNPVGELRPPVGQMFETTPNYQNMQYEEPQATQPTGEIPPEVINQIIEAMGSGGVY